MLSDELRLKSNLPLSLFVLFLCMMKDTTTVLLCERSLVFCHIIYLLMTFIIFTLTVIESSFPQNNRNKGLIIIFSWKLHALFYLKKIILMCFLPLSVWLWENAWFFDPAGDSGQMTEWKIYKYSHTNTAIQANTHIVLAIASALWIPFCYGGLSQ